MAWNKKSGRWLSKAVEKREELHLPLMRKIFSEMLNELPIIIEETMENHHLLSPTETTEPIKI